jgi:hypothetical protein
MESDLGQLKVSDSNKVVEERLKGAGRARALASRLLDNDSKRFVFDRRIKGACDGESPYSPAKLKRLAQSSRANLNFGEAKAHHSAAMVAYYDLLRGSSKMANVRVDQPDQFLKEYQSEIVSTEFDRMLKEWPGFLNNVDLIMWDRLRYGKGFAMWRNKQDPDFKWVNRFNVHVPDATEACVDDLEVLVIEEAIPVHTMWELAQKPLWNKEECIRAIKRAEPRTSRTTENRPDLEQAKVNDRDVLDGISCDAIQVCHVFQKEFNGKVSHYVVEMEGNSDPFGNDKLGDDYLFRAHNEFEKWDHCFWATFHENTDGSWNGASGLGKEIIAQIEIKNRVKCSMVDLGFMRSAINMRAQTAADWASGAAFKNMGPFNVFPPGLEPINAATYMGDLDGMFGLDREIENTLARNTGIYRQLPEKGQGNPLTATGEMLRSQQSTILSNSAVTRFYCDLDRLYAEIYRRATMKTGARSDMAKEFIKRCEDRGVSLDQMQKVEYVRAVRNVGNGSLVMRQQNLAQLASVSGMFPESGKQNWLRDTISSLTNVETADRYAPTSPQEEITLQHQIAFLENDSLANGSPALLASSDNHVTHAQTHMQAAVQGLQSVQQGGDPTKALAANEMLMPHALAHIQQLEGNEQRKNEFKALMDQWKQIAQANDQLRENQKRILEQRQKMAEAQQRAQAIQDGSDPQLVIQAAESEAKTRMAQERQAQAMRNHQQKHEQELAIADARTAAEIQRATATTLADIRSKQAKETQQTKPEQK